MFMRPLYKTFLCHWIIIILYVCFFQTRLYQHEKCSNSYNRQSSLVKHSHVHDDFVRSVCYWLCFSFDNNIGN